MEAKSSEKDPKGDTTIGELLQRLEKLEREKEELAESVRQMKLDKDTNGAKEETEDVKKTTTNLVMDAIDGLRKTIGPSMEKISSDIKKMTEDSVLAKYEVEAIAIENEEKNERNKREVIEEMRRLQRETEGRNTSSTNRLETVSAATTTLQESVDGISTRVEKLEGMEKKIIDGLTAKQNQLHRKIEERQEVVSVDLQTVLAAVSVLQKSVEKMSSKMEEMEEKRLQNYNKIVQRFDPLEYGVKFISRHVGKKTILALGGQKGSVVSDEILLLIEDKWIKLQLKLPKARTSGGAVYLNGEIYIFGGSRMYTQLYKLDNKTFKWIRLEDMNEGRVNINNSSVEWNGSIWVFGGQDGNKKCLKSVERYDPKENKWNKMPDMKYSRDCAAAAVHNGKFIVCGGRDGGSNYLKSVECFDPESGVWTDLNDMPTPLDGHSLVSYGNNLILMGGWDGKTAVNTVLEVSNLEGKGTWKQLPPMKQPRYAFSAAVLDNEIFVIGGPNDSGKTEIFNGKSWREGPQLPNECCYMSSIIIPRHLADILSNSTE